MWGFNLNNYQKMDYSREAAVIPTNTLSGIEKESVGGQVILR